MKITCLASGSSGNSYLVKTSSATLLMEAGLSVKALAGKGVKLSDIDLCLITHEHGDHAKYAQEYKHRGISIGCSDGTANALGIKHVSVVPSRFLETPGVRVASFGLIHDAAEPIGFIIDNSAGEYVECLAFITDTARVPTKINGITHLMIECNYSDEILSGRTDVALSHRLRVRGSHMDIDGVLEFLRENDNSILQEIYLMHLSDDHSDEAEFKRAVQARVGVPVWVCLKNGGVI